MLKWSSLNMYINWMKLMSHKAKIGTAWKETCQKKDAFVCVCVHVHGNERLLGIRHSFLMFFFDTLFISTFAIVMIWRCNKL